MKKLFNLLSIGIFAILISSCAMSDSEFLKNSSEKINKMTAKMEKVENLADYQVIVAEFQKLIDSAPSSLNQLNEEDLCKIEGGETFLEAVANFTTASASVAGKVTMNSLDSFNNMVSAVEDVIEKTSSAVNGMYKEDDDEEDDNDSEEEDSDSNYSEEELEMARMIDEYEKIVDKFISNQKGGMDILTNSRTYESALNLASKIEEIGELPSNLNKRFYDLQYKLTRAYTFGTHE